MSRIMKKHVAKTFKEETTIDHKAIDRMFQRIFAVADPRDQLYIKGAVAARIIVNRGNFTIFSNGKSILEAFFSPEEKRYAPLLISAFCSDPWDTWGRLAELLDTDATELQYFIDTQIVDALDSKIEKGV